MLVHDFARNIEQQFFPSERCPEPTNPQEFY